MRSDVTSVGSGYLVAGRAAGVTDSARLPRRRFLGIVGSSRVTRPGRDPSVDRANAAAPLREERQAGVEAFDGHVVAPVRRPVRAGQHPALQARRLALAIADL